MNHDRGIIDQEPKTYLHTVQVLNRNSRQWLLLLSYRPLRRGWWWNVAVAAFVRSGLTGIFVDSATVEWEKHRRRWRRGWLWRFRSRLYRDGCVQWHIVFGVGRSGSAAGWRNQDQANANAVARVDHEAKRKRKKWRGVIKIFGNAFTATESEMRRKREKSRIEKSAILIFINYHGLDSNI